MCGIVGFLGPSSLSVYELTSLTSRMTNTISHRGPDDSGTWVDHEVGIGLGSRRLKIIDLSPAGSQPMTSTTGRYVIVFNGEVYNHLEIRRDVETQTAQSPSWKGYSDTETILTAIEYLGLDKTLHMTAGMFAFALWDRMERILYLARDRSGEKPLYYGWQDDVFIFGSELKSLAAHPAFLKELDEDALSLFLRYAYVPTPWTIYRGIKKLQPGTYAKVSVDNRKKKLHVREYWKLKDIIINTLMNPINANAENAIKEFQNIFSYVISQHMTADVSVGLFLSGGIDSSIIALLAQAQSSQPLQTFSVGFDDPKYDESGHAKSVADYLGTNHTEIFVSDKDVHDIVPKLPDIYDEPFADSSQIPTTILAKMARRHVTVALSGDGGDELFGGYRRHFQLHSLYNVCRFVPRPMKWIGYHLLSTVSQYKKIDIIREMLDTNRGAYINNIYSKMISHWKNPEEIIHSTSIPDIFQTETETWYGALEPASQVMILDFLNYLPDDILVKVDRSAMHSSLETRTPFLDHQIIEFSWRLPQSMKIKHNHSKWILRQILNKYVPEKLISRPKQGFSIPLHNLLRGPLRDWGESLLSKERLEAEGLFAPEMIRHSWNELMNGDDRWSHKVWIILMFQAWKSRWLDGAR